MFVAAGHRAAAIFDRADMKGCDLLRLDRFPLRLNDLANFFFDRHLCQQSVDARFDFGVEAYGRLGHGPGLDVNGGGFRRSRDGRFGVNIGRETKGQHGGGGPQQGTMGHGRFLLCGDYYLFLWIIMTALSSRGY